MPADIVNLNKVRKAKGRAEKEKLAAENRVKFGRTKAERQATARNNETAQKRLDGVHRDAEQRASGMSAEGADNDLDPGTVS
jgi:hypothetical protein